MCAVDVAGPYKISGGGFTFVRFPSVMRAKRILAGQHPVARSLSKEYGHGSMSAIQRGDLHTGQEGQPTDHAPSIGATLPGTSQPRFHADVVQR